MGHRFEFDAVKKILLLRFEGRFTEESALQMYHAIRAYSTATDAAAGIWDLSSVTEFAVSAEFLRHLATMDPAMPNATTRPRFIVVPATVGFGLARMFEIAQEDRNPLLKVVRTMDEALTALGVQSPEFKPLD